MQKARWRGWPAGFGYSLMVEAAGMRQRRTSRTLPASGGPRLNFCYFSGKILNGGGGGNRTRVRKCVHEGVYVHSPSFKIRHPGSREARYPRPLGGNLLYRTFHRRHGARPAVVRLIPLAGSQG